ncbi:MAG: helix-turn-helix domain-containing protein [Acidobacteria bacterium]|nr:helix-turn-helix domain-containing protein [Acidobacteriota bacterium]
MTPSRAPELPRADLLPAGNGDVYDDGCLRVEHNSYYVACQGQHVRLTRSEFLLFSRLVMSMGNLVESEELWRHIRGPHKPYNADSLHVFIYRIRRKFARFGIRLENMVNVGYRLRADGYCRG